MTSDVGSQASTATMNQALTTYALALRNWAYAVTNLNTQVNSLGQGLAYMQSLGYSSAANPSNPGGVSDAQYALDLLSNMATIAGVYRGTVQQGGSGGTGASMFNFDNALSPLWAGQ